MNNTQKESQSIDPLALARNFPKQFGSGAQAIKISQLAGDASSRCYFRIVNEDSPSISFVLQCAEIFELNSSDKHPFLSGQRNLEAISIPVPQVLGVAPDRGWILLSDLGDDALQGHVSVELYKKAIDFILEWTTRLHPENPELPVSVKKSPQFSWAFDFEKLNFEMGFTAEHLFKNLLKSPQAAHFLEQSKKNSQFLSDATRYYCHRDYHSRNIMCNRGNLFVIDFQDARMGPITYDLVSLLWDPYVRLSENDRDILLNYWVTELEAKKSAPDTFKKEVHLNREERSSKNWRLELERMKVQRLLKAAGSYASFYVKKGRKDYLPSIERALSDVLTSYSIIEKDFSTQFTKEDAQLRALSKWALDEYLLKAGTF